MNSKRIAIASLCGLIAGLICISGGIIIFDMTFTSLQLLFVISSRVLIGFVIGISSLKINWIAHGLLIGFIIGFPFPIYDLIIGQGIKVALAAFSMSLIFGITIEYTTTKIFKAEII